MSTRFKIGPTTFLTTIALWERLQRGGAPVDPKPLNTVQPFIEGVLNVDQELTCNPGVWYGAPYPTFTYQWQQWDGTAWVNISLATNQKYTPTVDADFRCLVTGTNVHGSTTAESDTVDIEPALSAPAFSVLPSISGNTTTGSTLTLDPGVHVGNPTPTAAYQWQKFDSGSGLWADVGGATATTYVANVDGEYRAKVTLTNTQGTAVEVTLSIVVGAAVAPSLLESPQIGGNAYVGSNIYVIPGTWTDTDSYAYQWQTQDTSTLVWSNITGATGTTHDTTVAAPHRCLVYGKNTVSTVEGISNTLTTSNLPTGTTAGELLSNGSFTGASSTGWTVTGGGTTFTNSTVDMYSTTATQVVGQAISASAGAVLTLKFFLNAYVDGNIGPRVRFTDGTYMYFFGDQAGNSPLSGGEATTAVGTTVTAPTITVPAGKTVDLFEFRVSRRNSLVDVETDNYSLTGPVTSVVNQAPALDYAPQIRGIKETGQTLYSTHGVWFGNPEMTYAVQWYKYNTSTAAWVAVSGATSFSFVPTEAGDYRTTVTVTNSEGTNSANSTTVTVTGTSAPAPSPGTYSQFRLVVDANWGAPTTSLAEVSFRATAGGSSIAASSYSASSESLPVGNAFDGDANTWWNSVIGDQVPHVLMVCSSASALAQVAITYPNIEPEYYEEAPRKFRVQGWDGSAWITLLETLEAPRWSPGETRTYTL